MSLLQCGKEVLCLVSENTAACSKLSEFMTPDELEECKADAKKYTKFRLELADRADAAP